MKSIRWLGCLGILLATSTWTQAQDQQARRPVGGVEQLGGPLLAKGLEDRLNLTSDQKAKIAKIEKEFEAKAKDNEVKLRDLVQKARQDQDRAALRQLQDQLAEVRKVRASYLSQVEAVLTAEQKKAFEQPAATQRRPGGPAPSFLLSEAVQQRLNLTDDQKAKLEQLRKDFEAKALQVLTEEQRRRIEELKKGRQRQSSRDNTTVNRMSVVVTRVERSTSGAL